VAVSQRSSNPPPPISQPAPSRAREQAKRETREALLDAALEEFAERGLDAPSLDSICARAGYTRGAFYVHFADRDELVAAAMERVIGRFLDAIIATGDAALDFERSIRVFAGVVTQGEFFMQKSVRAYQLMQACARSPVVRDRYIALVDQAAGRVTHAIREGQAAGTVRIDIDPDAAGKTLIGLALGVEFLLEVGYPADTMSGADLILKLFAPNLTSA
jgi:TetR/AcrR family transcriptional regulator, transcriptional repressor for nem operon